MKTTFTTTTTLPRRLQEIYQLAGVSDPRTLIQKHLSHRVQSRIGSNYRQVLAFCERAFKKANREGESVTISSVDIAWRANHLQDLVEDEFVLIRRLCELGGYPVGLNEDGLIVSPLDKTIGVPANH